jgi:hypothetical protein
MSNNPGKKGKPAPWEKHATAEQQRALEEYKLAHHPAYAKRQEERRAAHRAFLAAFGDKPIWSYTNEESIAANKKLRAWDKKNPNPMSFDEFLQLEKDFDAQYTARDYS